jgi:hypothetical protein
MPVASLKMLPLDRLEAVVTRDLQRGHPDKSHG